MPESRHLSQGSALEAEYAAPPAEGSVSVLEPVLWQRLLDARGFEQVAAAWLALQCEMIDGVALGVVVRDEDGGQRHGIAIWPAGSSDVSSLSSIVDLALTQRRGVVQRALLGAMVKNDSGGREGSEFSRIAYPLRIDGAAAIVVVLEIDTVTADSLRKSMRDLQWGVAWLRESLLETQEATYRRTADHTSSALELIATALEEERFADACRTVITEMALRLGCDRVSVGFRRSGHSVVVSISHSARFGKRMNLVHMLGAAMDEAIDQRAVICYPQAEDVPHVCRAHEELARMHVSGAILTVPMFVRDTFVGAICFEREEDTPFSVDEVAQTETVCAVVGPILEEKRQNDRWIVFKIKDVGLIQLQRLLGPGYFNRKLAGLVVMAAVTFFTFATSDYHVTADAVVEGRIQRVVVAAFDGFIKDATVRAGDFVKNGELMASLDDRDFLLERLRWVTERQKSLYEYERALGQRNRVESRIAQSRAEQAEAWINLIDQKIARTRMVAPFDGIVVSGDLNRSIGAAVERGRVLFEVAPLDFYRVVLNVDESQIGEVEQGLQGRLRVASLPDEAYPLSVAKIIPVSVAAEGRNFLRVEADVKGDVTPLRPGMSGVGHIDVGKRRLIWIWTREFVDWARVVAWRWFG